jgi:protein SCO1/2
VALLFGLPLARALRTPMPPPLPVLATLPEFRFTAATGEPFGADELRGRVWVADFIFTRCPTVCPMLTERLGRVQHRARGLGPAFHLVSISIDPEHDTPPALAAFAAAHGASPRMWTFVTGPFADVQKVANEGFKVSVGRDGASELYHGSHVVLVDRELRIRGYYDVSTDAGVDQLMRDIGLLIAS